MNKIAKGLQIEDWQLYFAITAILVPIGFGTLSLILYYGNGIQNWFISGIVEIIFGLAVLAGACLKWAMDIE